MNGTTFAERLAERLAAARRQDDQRNGIEQQRMRELSERLAILEREGERLHRELIRPRAEELGRTLGAVVEHYQNPAGYHSYVRCSHTARFPATAKLGLGVEWDAGASEAWLVCSVDIVPVLMVLPGNARLPLEWEGPDEAEAAGWVEERSLQFVDACLAIANDPYYQHDNQRCDPVCGMRVSVAQAQEVETGGKRWYFCSDACRDRFLQAPELFTDGRVGIRT